MIVVKQHGHVNKKGIQRDLNCVWKRMSVCVLVVPSFVVVSGSVRSVLRGFAKLLGEPEMGDNCIEC